MAQRLMKRIWKFSLVIALIICGMIAFSGGYALADDANKISNLSNYERYCKKFPQNCPPVKPPRPGIPPGNPNPRPHNPPSPPSPHRHRNLSPSVADRVIDAKIQLQEIDQPPAKEFLQKTSELQKAEIEKNAK